MGGVPDQLHDLCHYNKRMCCHRCCKMAVKGSATSCTTISRNLSFYFFDILLTVHLSIFISVINQLDAQNFCFTISLFHASTCFKHMCSKHVEVRNKLIVKQKFCASSWLITEINYRFMFRVLKYES